MVDVFGLHDGFIELLFKIPQSGEEVGRRCKLPVCDIIVVFGNDGFDLLRDEVLGHQAVRGSVTDPSVTKLCYIQLLGNSCAKLLQQI